MNEIEQLRTDNALLREALANVAQSLAWNNFGECRSIPESTKLLQLNEADALAKQILARTPNESFEVPNDSI